LVKHLQAEFDEMVTLMPVDHGSSRMIEEEEADEWVEVKSRVVFPTVQGGQIAGRPSLGQTAGPTE